MILGAICGWGLWIVGLLLIGGIILDKEIRGVDKFFYGLIVTALFFLFGLICAENSFKLPYRDITYTYEAPTILVKTNNLVMAAHINSEGLVVAKLESRETKYWTADSSNIVVRVGVGNNLYGDRVKAIYEIIIH